jgi:hypothetical protein
MWNKVMTDANMKEKFHATWNFPCDPDILPPQFYHSRLRRYAKSGWVADLIPDEVIRNFS